MSPQYHLASAISQNRSKAPFTKAQKMMRGEDPRFRDLDRMLARAYVELQRQRIQQKKAGIFMPRMDLCDDPDNPYITAALELPGMKAEQLSVRIENGNLIVEGERSGPYLHRTTATRASASSLPEPPALYPAQELKYGKFRRELKLPSGVTAAHVRSMLAEGMLTISWPRDPSEVSGQGFSSNTGTALPAAPQTGTNLNRDSDGGDESRTSLAV